jgi:hypothetical protein
MNAAVATFALVLCPARLPAQSASTKAPAAAPSSAFEQWAKQAKNPTDWLTWGADLRVRNEYYDSAASLNPSDPLHEQDVIRFRARLWASATLVTNLSVNARLAAEPREWLRPSFAGAYKGQTGTEWRYGLFDNLSVKWTNLGNQPLTLTAGRQDITLGDSGDGWLVADGTPGDGSWAFFLDAIRLTFEARDLKTKFDAIYIYQNARPGEWIPTFGNSTAYTLTEQNEQGVIFYVSNKSLKNTTLDGYFIYKRDTQEFANGDNADIYTLGARLTGTPAEHWQYSAEGAYQFGKKQDPTLQLPASNTAWRAIGAFGANARLTYLVNDRLNSQVQLIYECLSGDDPKTSGRDEMFDILWGRWQRWSELYSFSYINENGGKTAQLNNLQRLGAGWSCHPMKDMTVSAVYNALFALEAVPTRELSPTKLNPKVSRFSHDGNFRGHYLQAILKQQFSKRVSGHLWGEFIWQGDYYAQRDLLSFLRAEVMVTF